MQDNLQIEVVAKIWHSTLKDFFTVFTDNTATCSMSCSICCLSLFIVKLVNLFIYYVPFFATRRTDRSVIVCPSVHL